MPRKQSSEVRLYCLKCKDYTQSIEPIIIKKDVGCRFHIKAMCSICNKFKTKFLNLEHLNYYQNKFAKVKMVQLLQILLNVTEV